MNQVACILKQLGNTMLLAGIVASVTLRISLWCHLLHLLASVEDIDAKMVAASGERSIGRKVSYYPHYYAFRTLNSQNHE
jgi:hypothetical protein